MKILSKNKGIIIFYLTILSLSCLAGLNTKLMSQSNQINDSKLVYNIN